MSFSCQSLGEKNPHFSGRSPGLPPGCHGVLTAPSLGLRGSGTQSPCDHDRPESSVAWLLVGLLKGNFFAHGFFYTPWGCKNHPWKNPLFVLGKYCVF